MEATDGRTEGRWPGPEDCLIFPFAARQIAAATSSGVAWIGSISRVTGRPGFFGMILLGSSGGNAWRVRRPARLFDGRLFRVGVMVGGDGLTNGPGVDRIGLCVMITHSFPLLALPVPISQVRQRGYEFTGCAKRPGSNQGVSLYEPILPLKPPLPHPLPASEFRLRSRHGHDDQCDGRRTADPGTFLPLARRGIAVGRGVAPRIVSRVMQDGIRRRLWCAHVRDDRHNDRQDQAAQEPPNRALPLASVAAAGFRRYWTSQLLTRALHNRKLYRFCAPHGLV